MGPCLCTFWDVLSELIIAFLVAVQTHRTHVVYMQCRDQVGCACQEATVTPGYGEVCFQLCCAIPTV